MHRDDQLARIEQWLATMHHQQSVRDTQLQINHQERQSASSSNGVVLVLLLMVTLGMWLSSCLGSQKVRVVEVKSASVYVP
jgi:hypothetical protein